MKRLAIQLSHELEVPRHDDLQADDRNQASCRDRLTLTETVPSSHYCSDFQDTRHRGRSQSPFFLNRPGGSGVGRTGTDTADGASPRSSSIGLVSRASEERGQGPRTEPVPVLPQSDRWVGRTGTDTVDFQISYELNHTFRVDEVEYRAHKLKSVGIHEREFNMLFKSDTIKE